MAYVVFRRARIRFVTSVRPHGATWFPLDGFSWNLILEYISKICRENSRFIKTVPRITCTYMETYVHVWQYLAEFFLEWDVLVKSYRENQNTRFIFSNLFFRKSCHLWDNEEKYGRVIQATDGNIIRRMRFAFWRSKATITHWEYVILIVFPRRQWLRECVQCYIIGAHCLSCYWLHVVCLPARIIEDVWFIAL